MILILAILLITNHGFNDQIDDDLSALAINEKRKLLRLISV
jgi:hypothetical protein